MNWWVARSAECGFLDGWVGRLVDCGFIFIDSLTSWPVCQIDRSSGLTELCECGQVTLDVFFQRSCTSRRTKRGVRHPSCWTACWDACWKCAFTMHRTSSTKSGSTCSCSLSWTRWGFLSHMPLSFLPWDCGVLEIVERPWDCWVLTLEIAEKLWDCWVPIPEIVVRLWDCWVPILEIAKRHEIVECPFLRLLRDCEIVEW